ncbi:MAG: polysaccharide biosynthesis protein [Clostridia bacterium]|nr:polysaccharide biosynthesis protein [Clostridia bacterium]
MSNQSTTKGFAILSAASMAVKILSLLYIPVLLAIIGEEGNGIYAAAYQVYVFIYVLTNSGIPVAISKLVAELIAVHNYKDAVRSFKIARFMLLLIGVIMSLLMFTSARFLSQVLHFEKSFLAILALAPILLFTSVASAYRGYFQGQGNMVPTAVSQVVEQIINTIFTLIFAALFIKYGLEAACAGGTIGTSLGALIAVIVLLVYFKKHRKIKVPKGYKDIVTIRYRYKDLVKKIINYSIPITLCVGLQYAGNLVDLWNTKSRLLAAGFSDVAATQMYSYLYKYQQLMNAPIAIIAALAAAVLPAISGAIAAKDKTLAQNKANYAFRLCFLVVFPSAVGLSVLSKPIYEMLRFGGGYNVMLYGSIVLVLMSVAQIQAITLQGSSRLYTVTLNQFIGIAVKITVNYFLIAIPQINILGTVIGSITGYGVTLVLNSIAIRKHLGIKTGLTKLAVKPFIATAGMGLVVYLCYNLIYVTLGFIGVEYIINAIAAISAISVGAVVYTLGLILVRGITRQDIEVIPARFVRFIPRKIVAKIR